MRVSLKYIYAHYTICLNKAQNSDDDDKADEH